jgi:hypothetical protein
MKQLILLGCVLPILGLETALLSKDPGPVDWLQQSVSSDAPLAARAQEHLRDAGPSGLRLLLERYAPQIAAHQAGAPPDEQWKRIASALDKVGGQYDDYASQLYWYTDLEKAKAAARASGRPILSLRLLGRLDTDLSCANSRFFRTTLYPSAEINRILKDQYVLHWESVRPAPRVTIDFGDGRILRRTITGNSIHYILDANGQVLDALPGLYSAPVFANELRAAADAAKAPASTTAHLQATRNQLLDAWAGDLAVLGIPLPERPWNEAGLQARTSDATWQQIAQLHEGEANFDANVRELMLRKFPSAQSAAPIAVGKSAIEVPLLRSMGSPADRRDVSRQSFPSAQSAAPIARTKSGIEVPLLRSMASPAGDGDASGQSLPSARTAAPVTLSKRLVEAPMLRSFENSTRVVSLRKAISLDTVENNYMRRTKILAFIAGPAARSGLSLAAINEWVYSQVFLTPSQDPWLGLAPADVFSAIDDDGRIN